MMHRAWQTRSPARIPDAAWAATIQRVRGEFEEMPCLRVTPDQARMLFGLSGTVSIWVLSRLEHDGFLELLRGGEYARRSAAP